MKEVTNTYRRSDALYHSTLGRRDLCDMVARMEAERGECRAVKVDGRADDNDPYDVCSCSECGAYLDPMWHYCGICGRKVVSS